MFAFRVLPAALLLAACGFPRPERVGDAGLDAPTDAEIPPGISIRVAGTGDDANDGITQPVKTLKHAIGLAAANPAITSIVLATGRYASDGGEIFPYTVPANLTILGPAGGGAILAGSTHEPGITIDSGTLRDLELEDFTVAVTATGTTHLSGLHIRTGLTAMRAGGNANVTIDNVDIAGTPGACAKGIELSGAAQLTATALVTRALKTSIQAQDQTTLILSHTDTTGSHCDYTSAVISLSTDKVFVMEDSSIDGGDYGINSVGASSPPRLTIHNTNIKNLTQTAINMDNGVLEVIGGTFSNQPAALIFSNVNVTITDATLTQHMGAAIQLGGGQFKMRNCTFTANHEGLYIPAAFPIDLGTEMGPGNNIFQNGFNSIGLEVESNIPAHVSAIGNTWRPGVQGADAAGHYPKSTINGPVGFEAAQGNFKLPMGASMDL